MEQFKAVEKEMKTKAYSKEGLSAASRLDPKEKEKAETCEFLSNTVYTLQQKIEAMEAEEETISASMKKGKKDAAKSLRLSDIARISEQHKWHVGKLELLLRALQNGNIEVSQVLDIQEAIKYYAEDGHNADFCGEDETIYDDINLGDEEAQFGMNNDNDRVSSQDTQSIQEDEHESRPKAKVEVGPPRRSSAQMKSPLPVLATLHHTGPVSGTPSAMKPAPPPTRLPGETLKYASAAAAGAAGDKMGVGIAPLPPPPGASPAISHVALASKASSTASPQVAHAQPVNKLISNAEESRGQTRSPALSSVAPASRPGTLPSTPAMGRAEPASQLQAPQVQSVQEQPVQNGNAANGAASAQESIYHLPPGFQDLMHSFEITKARASAPQSAAAQRLLVASHSNCPEPGDAEKPRHYRPETPYATPSYYPQEPLPMLRDPRMFEHGRFDQDTLFYLFYYRQGTYEQYMAAKALKSQSWRFHKQYQTWFQRHEEPKTITEEYEQGMYRFFDYESTW